MQTDVEFFSKASYNLLHYVCPFRELFRKASTFLGYHSVECLLLQFIKQKNCLSKSGKVKEKSCYKVIFSLSWEKQSFKLEKAVV